MAVDTPSKDYQAQSKTWAKIRALSSGVEAARSYVACLPGMEDDRYQDYKNRAYYLPALPRTVETFAGLIFLRDPQAQIPDAMRAYLEDATLTGLSFDGLASQVVTEQLEASRVAVLVDYPQADPNLTRAEAEKLGLRAYARVYQTESILGVEYGTFGGVRKLSRVRLLETRTVTDPGDYTETEVRRVRILELANGFYAQRVLEQNGAGDWIVVETAEPIRNGQRLDYIPLFFFNHRDHDGLCLRPPLADLADVSVSHLNSATLLEWGEMWTANPTPWAAGVQAPPTDESGRAQAAYTVKLGSSELLLLDQGGEVGFLEFTGAGLERLSATMDRKEKHMAALGTRILLDDPRAPVAAETVRLQRAGENSTLGKVVTIANAGLTAILRELALWSGVTDKSSLEKITYKLNRNFVPSGMTGDEIRALVSAVQAGELSTAEFFSILQSRDVIDPSKELDAHLFELEEDDGRLAARGALAAPAHPE